MTARSLWMKYLPKSTKTLGRDANRGKKRNEVPPHRRREGGYPRKSFGTFELFRKARKMLDWWPCGLKPSF